MKTSHKVCVVANGCPENRIDAAGIQEFFKENGWAIITDYRDADIILFNACGATLYSQESSIGIVKQIKIRKKRCAQLIVCGCLPKINKERLREVFQGFIFGSDEIQRLCQITETKTTPQDFRANYLLPIMFRWNIPNLSNIASLMFIPKLLTRVYHLRHKQGVNNINPHTFCIKVSTGCLNTCSFCVIRLSRERVNSKPISKVVDEFKEGRAKGYKEFALIGTDLGAYGRDQGTNLTALLRELVERKGDYKIKLQYIQPRFLIEMMPELQGIFQSGKISYLSSVAESGNNRILGLMKRGYRMEDFKEAILTLNGEFPEIQMSTQVMVAFPSEREEEFHDTIRLLDEVSFDFVEAYLYQARPNTVAAKMKGQIAQKVRRRRLLELYTKSIFKEYKVFIW